MSLIKLRNIYLRYGEFPLFDHLNLHIEAGERVCLIGRNGAGKSTLLKLLMGEVTADEGDIEKKPQLKIVRLNQEVPENLSGTVFEVVSEGLGEAGLLISRYQHLLEQLTHSHDSKLMQDLEKVQHQIEVQGAWNLSREVENIISLIELPRDQQVSELSGGLKRRVLLAKALVSDPDLLLLDEPTNHLDIEAITWLEKFLCNYPKAQLFITHDRVFMQKIATRIVELEQGKIISWEGDYASFLKHKAESLNAEAKEQALFDKRLAQEEVWIRQGIKARRTRNEGRVRALETMREQRKQRRARPGQVKLETQSAEQSGKIVFEVENISFNQADKTIIKNFSTTILRGDKVGIIGPNGSGKSTLLNLLLGDLEPQAGRIGRGTKLEVSYFDQLRQQLDLEKSVQDNIYTGSEFININGQSKHVISYLQDFLFSPQQARSPVKSLSGGERNRLLLARLFTKASNVLVLDEPTNDLDAETLELLEEQLLQYEGTLLLVSHDRALLNNVVTSTLVFEGDGKVMEYVGGYDDYLRQRALLTDKVAEVVEKEVTKPNSSKKKLSYNEQRELEQLPEKINLLEKKLGELQIKINDPAFYQQDKQIVQASLAELQKLETDLQTAYQRWEYLEDERTKG